jgi:hypothetical protein
MPTAMNVVARERSTITSGVIGRPARQLKGPHRSVSVTAHRRHSGSDRLTRKIARSSGFSLPATILA